MRLAELFTTFFDDEVPVGFVAYDGSSAGPARPVATLDLRTPEGLRHLIRAPGELGLARAYVTGGLEVRGDMHAALDGLLTHIRKGASARQLLRFIPDLGTQALGRAPVPPEEMVPGWRRGLGRHSKRRDAAAIAHHYDVGNRFYELVLGRSMTYSCAVFSSPETSLEDAQREKIDLICRKLDLRPDQRLLDVGAGWGALAMHAAANYGVRVLGVTLSGEQAAWAEAAIANAGLTGRAEVRQLDWRDLRDEGFDAIASVGAMEHFGLAELGAHFASMSALLRPEGRMLNHCITRPSSEDSERTGPFIDRYVFPDGELESPAMVMGAMHDNGFELRHEESLREHYAMTLREWGANLERHWAEAVAAAGERRARVWRLYMAVSRVGFERGRTQIHQMLGVRLDPDGRSGMPLRPDWEPREARSERPPRRFRRRGSRIRS
ncbi:MAG TPA: cyclopropane-fatty-acyl-phospholipid synthase family protein [Thermoleophilaceae bacterium]|jgi:cyclopropane-fatty-acyl-phospholipid synthase